MVDLRERQYVSQFANDRLGLAVHKDGQPGDPDGNEVTIQWLLETDPPTLVFERLATKVGTGLYETQLLSEETSVVGLYTVIFSYVIDGAPQTYRTYASVGEASPAYDNLDAGMKEVVEGVWFRFADLFDSPLGGPHLQTYFQSHFGRGRIAQLLRVAMGLLNTTAQPYQTFSLDMPGQFPVAKWGALLESALYVEVIKHLIRSYVEQPAFVGGNVTRLDRRDYMQRWQEVLEGEREQLTKQLEVFKISNMGLGKPRVLVSGGVYGRYGPTRVAGFAAARPMYWSRFY